MRLLLTTTALFGLAAAPASAVTHAVQAVEVENAAAVVTVITEDRADVDVTVSAGARLAAPSVRVEGDHVLIDGGLRNRLNGCTTVLGVRQVRVRGVGNVREADLPRVTIRTPRTLDVELGGAVFADIGASGGGEVTLNGCGDTALGASSGALDVTLNGSGDVNAQRVGGALEATLNGSGSLRVASAGEGATLALRGSGDLIVGDVGGPLHAAVQGSGSLRTGSSAGDARLALQGSGDVEMGAVTGSLEAEVQGSGDVDVASVRGDSATLQLASSGDLTVRGGAVQRLSVRSTGSGDVRFGGSAAVTRANLTGSGDITVANSGQIDQMSDTGSGDVRLGN